MHITRAHRPDAETSQQGIFTNNDNHFRLPGGDIPWMNQVRQEIESETESEDDEEFDDDQPRQEHETHNGRRMLLQGRIRTRGRRVLLQEQAHIYAFDCVAVGLASTRFQRRQRLPGWDEESYGYHGDDGAIFHGRGNLPSNENNKNSEYYLKQNFQEVH